MNNRLTSSICLNKVNFPEQEDCPACSQVPQHLTMSEDAKLQEVIDYLKESAQ